ncbi:MAG: zinc-binding dehydrogenase [Myxococcota bacterium]
MKAIVYHGKTDFRYENAPDPRLESDTDAIVRISETAICGSDLHLWHGGLPEGIGAAGGFAVGHEFMGVVEAVGKGVQGVKKGDRVLTSCTVGCGNCAMCRRGVYSGCKVMTGGGGASNVFGFSSALPGGQAEAARVPFADTNLFQVPPDMSDDQALFLTDILPTGYMGAEFAEVSPGDTVVVFGCGPVGTFAQMCSLLRGAARVIAVDLDDGRLERARQLGCDAVNPTRQNLGERVLELTHGVGADASIEAVGREDLITQAAMVTRPGGRVAVIGVLTTPTANLPWFLMFLKNLTVRTGLVNPQIFIPKLLPLIEQGRLDPTVIISHRLPLKDGPNGYEIFAGHKENVLKVVLKP